jgi:predicted ester cyclase
MSTENTQQVIEGFLNSEHGENYLAADAVFKTMFDGNVQRGPREIMEMMKYLYQIAFQAQVEPRKLIITDGHATLEADFVGVHVGEFAGIPATGKDVRVPFCVVYDVVDKKISKGRIYFEMPVLMAQLGTD